ncbi:MAG TPA: AMP-binding protein [Methylocella sp.]|nr:AMP-binding protein [Methylocella sp.]
MLSTTDKREHSASKSVQNLASLIKEGIFKDGDAPLIFWSEAGINGITAGEIWQRAGRLAAGLRTRGLNKGDRIAIQVPNSLDGLTAFLACTRLGLVIVPLVMSYGAHELDFIVGQSGSKALITPGTIKGIDAAQRIASLKGGEALHTIILIGGEQSEEPRAVSFDDLLNTARFAPDDPDIPLNEIFVVIYTSGTTGGEPKGAIHTHETFGRELVCGADVWIPQGEQRAPLVIFPPGHIAGVAYSLMPIIDGSGAVYMESWSPEAAARLIEHHSLAWTFGTPFHLTTLLEAATTGQLKSLRMFGCGGASVPPTLIERADAEGIAAFRAYGSTEHPSISSGRHDDPLRVRAYTDGRPMPGVTVRIIDDQGRPCGTGEVGEITTRGPDLFCGYLDGSRNAGALVDGWYFTGDLGRIDQDGALTIVDRKKDIVIRGGENISSKEVEDIILQMPDVLAVAVVGWPDPQYGERVAAFVQTKEGTTVGLDKISAHFRSLQVARHKTPERVIATDEFERSAAGKILKVPLRARAAQLSAQEA